MNYRFDISIIRPDEFISMNIMGYLRETQRRVPLDVDLIDIHLIDEDGQGKVTGSLLGSESTENTDSEPAISGVRHCLTWNRGTNVVSIAGGHRGINVKLTLILSAKAGITLPKLLEPEANLRKDAKRFYDPRNYKAGLRKAIPDLRYGRACCTRPELIDGLVPVQLRHPDPDNPMNIKEIECEISDVFLEQILSGNIPGIKILKR